MWQSDLSDKVDMIKKWTNYKKIRFGFSQEHNIMQYWY